MNIFLQLTNILLQTDLKKEQTARKFVPANALENQVTTSETTVKFAANDWDLMHLKMLSVYSNDDHMQQLLEKGRELISFDGLRNIGDNSPINFKNWNYR